MTRARWPGVPASLSPRYRWGTVKSHSQLWAPGSRDEYVALEQTGTLVQRATRSGLGTTFGSGNYLKTPTGIVYDSGGAGSSLAACRLQAFVFTSLQNATQTTIGSWGTSETDNTPFRLYQASGSTLQWYGNGGYQQLGYSEIGKQQVIVERYIDYPPYTTTVFLDGVAVYSIDSYVYDVASKRIYIGSGYPTQYDGIIHQHLFIQGVIWTDAEIAEYSARPWSSLREATRRPFIFFGPPAGGTGTDAAIAGTQESDVGAITAEATTGAALAGTQASDVGAVTVEATTGAAIAGTQDSDVAALVVDSEVGTTSCAIGGVQASDVGAIAVEATLGLELAGTQASNLGYIVVEATLPAAIAGTQASDVAAVTVTAASSSIWTDIPAASTIWTDL